MTEMERQAQALLAKRESEQSVFNRACACFVNPAWAYLSAEPLSNQVRLPIPGEGLRLLGDGPAHVCRAASGPAGDLQVPEQGLEPGNSRPWTRHLHAVNR